MFMFSLYAALLLSSLLLLSKNAYLSYFLFLDVSNHKSKLPLQAPSLFPLSKPDV